MTDDPDTGGSLYLRAIRAEAERDALSAKMKVAEARIIELLTYNNGQVELRRKLAAQIRHMLAALIPAPETVAQQGG